MDTVGRNGEQRLRGARPLVTLRNTFLLGVVAAAVAVSWLAIDIAFPGLGPSGMPSGFFRGVIHTTILFGLWLGLARTQSSERERIGTWLAIAVPFTAWMILIWTLAAHDVFRPVPGSPDLPVLPVAIALPIAVGAAVLTRSRRIATLLDAMPVGWLIGLQFYRMLGVAFIAGWTRGTMPGEFALPAGIGDAIVGVLALPAARLASSRTRAGAKAAVAWNALGLTDLAIAVAMGFMTFPTRLQVLGLDRPNTQLGAYPTVMIPAFAVPMSVLLHVLSLRQLRRLKVPAVASNPIGIELKAPKSAWGGPS
jgi:hypothetical protein